MLSSKIHRSVLPAAAAASRRFFHAEVHNKELVQSAGFINGKWVEAHSNKHFAVIDPSTDKEIARVANMGRQETNEAIAAALAAQKKWRKTTPAARSVLLKKWHAAIVANTEDLAVIASVESGKPLPEAKGEVAYAAGFIDFYAHEIMHSSGFLPSTSAPDHKIMAFKEPVGVCGIVTPWNFPLAMITRKLGPCLAAGCTAVVKPAAETPLSALALAKLAEDVGIPPGVINVVPAPNDKAGEVGGALTNSHDVRKISFTGSTRVGKLLMEQSAETVKRVSLELGGNAPFIGKAPFLECFILKKFWILSHFNFLLNIQMAAKRFFDDSDTDPNQPNYKRMRTAPSFASVIKEVVMVKFLDNVSSALEPMLRRVVHEEVESGLRRYSCRTITRSPSLRIKALEPSNLRLTFNKKLSVPIFTGSKIVAGDGQNLQILLVDTSGEGMVPTALPYPIKVEIVVLDGDFLSKQNDQTSWTHEEFNKSIVKERTGKRPLLAGELNFTMRDGVVYVGEIEFTDNSSWIRSGKFRLGAKLVQIGTSQTTVQITEAITESFRVKDHRGELYKKHYPPALGDEVWRLEKIGKDGTFHKKLSSNGINTVQDFLKLATVDTRKLRTILGRGMSDKIWDATYKHANTCEKGSKLYMATGANYTLFLSPICQVVRAIVDGQICANRDLTGNQREYIQNLVKVAYANWSSLEEVDTRVNEPALLTQGETVVDQYSNVLYQQPSMLRSYQLNAVLTDASEQLVDCNNDWIDSSSYIFTPADHNGGF